MRRRTVLQAIAGVGALTLSGCAQQTGVEARPREFNDSTSSPTPTMTPSIPPNDSFGTETPTPLVRGQPSVLPDDDGPVQLIPETVEVTTTAAGLGFILKNDGEAEFGWNPCDWGLFEYVDETWQKVAPDMVNQPYSKLASGESHRYSLSVGEGDAGETDYCGRKHVVELLPGSYAFCVYGSYAGEGLKTYVAPFTISTRRMP